jgi:hypothetical protein
MIACGLAAGLALVPLLGEKSARADDAGAVAAGMIGGLALGALAGSAIAGAAPPPPPPPVYYAPPPYAAPAYAPAYAPVYAPPPRCWYEPQQIWNGYAYVIQRVRVCN